MYNAFCYAGFKAGILKEAIDASYWDATSVLLKQAKIEQEENILQLLDIKEPSTTGDKSKLPVRRNRSDASVDGAKTPSEG